MTLTFKTKISIYQSMASLGPVHTYPDIFENASFFIRFGFPSTRRRRFQSPKTKLFESALQSGSFSKRRFPVLVWTGENGAFRKRGRHNIDLRRIRACARFFGDHARAFCLSVFFRRSSNAEYRYRLWNFVLEYRIASVTSFPCGRGYFRKRYSCGRESL